MTKIHIYLSTACLHDLHEKCRLTWKYCAEHCACWCHIGPAPEKP